MTMRELEKYNTISNKVWREIYDLHWDTPWLDNLDYSTCYIISPIYSDVWDFTRMTVGNISEPMVYSKLRSISL